MTPRPTFPIFAWNVPAKHFDRWLARGINTLMGVGLEVKDSPEARRDWALAAGDKGLWVIADLRPYTTPNMLAALYPMDEPDRRQANPAVPKWDGLTHDQLKPQTDALRAAYPGLPIHMTLTGDHLTLPNRLAYYQSIADLADTFSEDWYPFSKDANRYTNALKGQAIDVARQATGKPVYSIIETVWQQLENAPNGRQTRPDEVAAALDLAVAHGAAGVGFFSHVFDGKGHWRDFDQTPQNVSDVITSWCRARGSPAPLPAPEPPAPDPIAAIHARIDGLADLIGQAVAKAAQAQADAAAANNRLAKLKGALSE